MRRLFIITLLLLLPGVCFSATSDKEPRNDPQATDEIPFYRPSLGGVLGPANPDAYGRLKIGDVLTLAPKPPISCTVDTLPASPEVGDVVIVHGLDGPCNLAGGGTYLSMFRWDGASWVCLSSQESESSRIFKDSSFVEAKQTSVDIEVDGEKVAEFTKDQTRIGPIAATRELEADGAFSSAVMVTGGVAGEPIGEFQTVYVGTGGKYFKADANAAGKFPAVGISVNSADTNDPINVMLIGYARNNSWSWTPLDDLCLSETAGGIIKCSDASICSAADDCVQVIGKAITSSIVEFNFTGGYVTCTGD